MKFILLIFINVAPFLTMLRYILKLC